MGSPNLQLLMGQQAAAAGEEWDVLVYTDMGKKGQNFQNYSNWSNGYESNVEWCANQTAPLVNAGNWNPAAYACDRFGRIGRCDFHSHTASDSGAATRVVGGGQDGFYNAAYTMKNMTKVALVGVSGSDTVDLTDPTNSTNHLVYDLVGTSGDSTDADAGLGDTTLIDFLQDRAAYNRNNPVWHGDGGAGAPNNQLFNGPDCRNFTSGGGSKTQAGYSGKLISSAGKMHPIGVSASDGGGASIMTSVYPDYFCFWGINLQSDHDTQVCCAYYGNGNNYDCLGRPDNMGSLSTQTAWTKRDNWRNKDPDYTFWSLWGNDWHSDSQKQNISGKAAHYLAANQNDYYQGGNLDVAGTSYAFSMQSWPGTAVPQEGVNQDPNQYMCPQVYFLGYGEK